MVKMKFKPGLMKGVSYADYDRLPGLRSSTLKDMRQSPAHARYRLDHPMPATAAMRLGEATHAAVLEPDRFEMQYVARPEKDPKQEWSKFNKNSKKYIDGREIWDKAHENCVILSASEHKTCCALRDAAWAHPLAKRILTGDGANEVVACWEDPSVYIPCKARIDRYTTYEGHTIILDIKTCRDAEPWEFARAAAKFGYHLQGAWYRRGLNVLEARPRQFWMLALESKEPYCVAVYRLDDEALDQAEATLQNFVYQYAECEKDGSWPGYGPGVETLYLPKYAYYEEGQNE